MKTFSVLVYVSLLLVATSALPSHERYTWIADDEGNLHLVDLLYTEPYPKAFDGDSDVKLYLYTQSNPSSPQTIKLGDSSTSSNFNAAKPTRFVVHGWNSHAGTKTNFVRGYLDANLDYNVILVDWSGPASAFYTTAIGNSQKVAEYIALVINDLVDKRGLNLDDTFLIGHSLGGQLVGVLGNRLLGKVKQVVGLDAAGPLFQLVSLENRLDPSDGQLVQGIHTNGGVQGWLSPLGDIDFFPNGGTLQAGCGTDLNGSCSHARANSYYVESLSNNQFVGTLCSSYLSYSSGSCSDNARNVMGEYASASVPGSYYLDTNTQSPFALGNV